jgi:hypothetical protein
MAPSQVVSCEFLDVSDHTFSPDLSFKDWDLSDHSDSTGEAQDFHAQPKSVSFGKVRIRSYPLILGDNPSCSGGLPVTLDWERIGQSEEFDLNVIDSDDLPKRPVARLSSQSRLALLLRRGMDKGDTSRCYDDVDAIKRLRSLTTFFNCDDNSAVTNMQPTQSDEQTISKESGEHIGTKHFGIEEYFRIFSSRRRRKQVTPPSC